MVKKLTVVFQYHKFYIWTHITEINGIHISKVKILIDHFIFVFKYQIQIFLGDRID